MTQDHDEGEDRRRPDGFTEIDAAKLAPVALGLVSRRRFDPAEGPDRRLVVTGPDEIADGLVGAGVAVFLAEVIVLLDAGRPLLSQGLSMGVSQAVAMASTKAKPLDLQRLAPAVGGPVTGPTAMIADGALADAQDAGGLGRGLASLVQDLDRHDLLPRELGQGVVLRTAPG